MAEFQEVMKHINRICVAHENCDENGCPLRVMGCCGNIGSHCSEPLQAERIEKTVMRWAAEHPEPVYPTWGEYLHTLHNKPSSRELSQPIPADIAQKLGLEPKGR